MTTWIVGDIHGCAEELAELIGRLDLGEDGHLVACGDLFHRGPDPAGVMDLLTDCGASFVLGNHERAILRRVHLDPRRADGSDRPPLREHFPAIDADDLRGDGDRPCHVPAERRRELLVFLQRHSGYFLHSQDLPGRPRTRDGRDFVVVHAGVDPGIPLEENDPFDLTRIRHIDRKGRRWWYEAYDGRDLVLYGHSSNPLPRAHRVRGRLQTLGLDTACVYGGALTAYSPELDEFVRVPAAARRVA